MCIRISYIDIKNFLFHILARDTYKEFEFRIMMALSTIPEIFLSGINYETGVGL